VNFLHSRCRNLRSGEERVGRIVTSWNRTLQRVTSTPRGAIAVCALPLPRGIFIQLLQ
jgi:hypothetical protein